MTRTRTMRVALAASLAAALAVPAVASAQTAPDAFPDQSAFQKVMLNDRPGEPMSLAVLPDNRVLHSARTGEIRIHNPRTGLNTLVADFKQGPRGLYQHDEEGMQGIAVDPNFSTNNWVYVFYSPRLNTPVDVPGTGINEGDAPENLDLPGERTRLAQFAASSTTAYLQLSRFKLRNGAPASAGGTTGATLDFASEQEIIRVPADRGICCHVGGQIEFDDEGNLFLSTGDDTNPFQSAGYTPIDDRSNRNPAFDARRTSGNTNDLRGKLLRIRVGENGGYTVPNGNLFRRGQAQTRAEIYAMGLRNPFRFSVNRTNGDVYMADYSPDANVANAARGPEGHGRWMLIRRPGNYGWPFCITPNLGYIDYDFTPDSQQSGEEFNCNRTVNDSRNNTGLRVLPQVIQPDVFYSFGNSSTEANALFPQLMEQSGGNGVGPMAGPAYQFDRTNRSENRFPASLSGHPIFYEWTRDYAKVFELNRPNGGRIADIHHLFGGRTNNNVDDPANPNIILDNPMDMEFGPDGALYVLEYGDGFFSENPEAQLARIDFVRRNQHTPRVRVSATPVSSPTAPLTVQFSSAGTVDVDDTQPLAYAWDFDANGTVDSRQANPTFTYAQRGVYDATLRVSDRTGRSASNAVRVTVGNQAPVVRLQVVSTTPPFGFGDTVNFTVTVTDDQPVDCERVSVAYILGHDAHGHPQTSTAGCSGTLSIPVDESHIGQNIAAVFVATYSDNPGGGEESQQGTAEVVLRPPAPPTNQG